MSAVGAAPSHSKKDPAAAGEFRQALAEYLENLEIPEGSKVKIWMMDETRFGLHTDAAALGTQGKASRGDPSDQMRMGLLHRSFDVIGGQAHFCQIPAVSHEWDHRYLENLAGTQSMRTTLGHHRGRDRQPGP